MGDKENELPPAGGSGYGGSSHPEQLKPSGSEESNEEHSDSGHPAGNVLTTPTENTAMDSSNRLGSDHTMQSTSSTVASSSNNIAYRVPSALLQFEPDQDVAMSHDPVFVGPPAPQPDLGLHRLSLFEAARHPAGRPQRYVGQNRASVAMEPHGIWKGTFPEIQRNDAILVFGKGHLVTKVDKYPFCNASRFFYDMLDGPFVPEQVRVLRLRDDFPYAIQAMIEFVYTGNYTFKQAMRVEHPHITAFDFSIHAYLVGSKYGIRPLRDLGLHRYIQFGAMCLMTHLKPFHADVGSLANLAPGANLSPGAIQALILLLRTLPNEPDARIESAHPLVTSFLDSLVLLWRNTPKRADYLRLAALQLIKPYLNRLLQIPYFAILVLEVQGLEDDIVHSLQRDGLAAIIGPALPGQRDGMRFGVSQNVRRYRD